MNEGTQYSDRAFAIAIAVAPLLMLASAVGFVINGEGQNNGELGGIVQVWAFVAFAVAIVGLTRMLTDAAPRAAAVLLVTGLAGAGGGLAYGIDAIQAAVFGNESVQDTTSAAGPLALQLPGILFPLTLLAIAILLIRTNEVPRWPAVALAVGAVAFPIANIPDIEVGALIADAILVIAGLGLASTVSARGGMASTAAPAAAAGSGGPRR
jgi:hypothetical protein